MPAHAVPDPALPICAPTPFFGANRTAVLISDLATQGWAHMSDAVPAALAARLLSRAQQLDTAEALVPGKVGQGRQTTRAGAIRETRLCWLTGDDAAESDFLDGAEALRQAINEALFAGLFEFEAHFSIYPPGGHYARHLDAFAGARRARIVSLVVWLNPDWMDENGGALTLWSHNGDTGAPARRFAPNSGDLLLMMSEDIPHAVLTTTRNRYGIAGWFRVNPGVGGVLDPPA